MNRISSPIRTALLLALLPLATLAAGCGEKEEGNLDREPEPFTLALDFYVNPDHAGILIALERGLFEEAGLDVSPEVPSDPSAPIRQVAAGRADLAISYEPEVLLAREQGLPVKAVAALVPTPLTSLIWIRESGVTEVADLAGRTVATAGIPYQQDFLEAILAREDLTLDQVSQIEVGLGLLPAVLSGRADAMLGGFRNVEGVDLAERGERPTVLPVDRLGIPTYDELVLVANEDRLDRDPEAIRLFIAALEQGTREAVAEPAAATEAVLDAGDGLDPKLTAAEVDATLPLLAQPGNSPFGHMEAEEWERFAAFFADRGLLTTRPRAAELFTNEYLGGRIPE